MTSTTWAPGQPLRRKDTDAVGKFEEAVFPRIHGGRYEVLAWWYAPGKIDGPMTLDVVSADLVGEAATNACAGHCGAVACPRSFGHETKP